MIHGFFGDLVVLCSQEDDIRDFVRQEMSQHCGEWVWCGVSFPNCIPGHLDGGPQFPRTYRGQVETDGYEQHRC
jgi:hypothetical protein